VAELGAEIQDSMGPLFLAPSEEHAPAPSVALITAEMPEPFPPVGGRALEVASMGVASMVVPLVAVVDAGDRMRPRLELVENSRKGEKYYAAENFKFGPT
jgi:hypothetical protein